MKNIYTLLLFLLFSFYSNAQVYINEICPANADINYDPDYYNFSGWVELYNAGSTSVNLSGYYLSDKFNAKTKWTIPTSTSIASKGYILIWCDEMNNKLHTIFNLDAEGEELILSNASGVLVDKVVFPVQYTNISFGRVGDGATTWGYLLNPTPKSKNNLETATKALLKPDFSVEAGIFSSLQQVTISSPEGATIRYTIDGSEPDSTSTLYTTPVNISQTTILKAKAYQDGFIPSNTKISTYFINEHAFTLPVVSLSTKPKYLTDNLIGIYTVGTNGIGGFCQSEKYNWNQDWERHANFEVFSKLGKKVFDQGVDLRIGGNCSRSAPQKTLVVKARDKYGSNVLKRKFFDSKGGFQYGGFFLSNSGNDFNLTQFRDALLQSLVVGQMDLDYQAYQPSVLYLNGQYWGIQNLREKIDADYIFTNFGVKKDDVDLIETYGNALEGTSDVYWDYINTLQTLNKSLPSTYDYIDSKINVQEYINYLSTQIYVANTDWPGNNQKFWRQISTNGKFRWILWDLDFGFAGYQDKSYATHPTLNFATDPNSGVAWPNPAWSTLPIRMVLANPTFKTRFIQTLVASMNTTFKPERVIQMVDSFQTRIQAEMPYHKERWGGNMSDWNYEVQRLRDFASQRYVFMQDHTAQYFGLGSKVKIGISAGNDNTFKINEVIADRPLVDGVYYQGLPIKVEAIPKPGYSFSHWQISQKETTNIPMIDKSSSWKYHDLGTNLGVDWRDLNFDDSGWQAGNAQLGYGENDEQTVVGYGNDANNKFITTYFRKKFDVADTTGISSISSTVLFDDGVVVYLNGTEIYRNNMPAGTITSSTPAASTLAVENVFVPFSVPKGLLVNGQNIIAIEVHQVSGTSSDVSFDFSLNATKEGNETSSISDQIVILDTVKTDLTMQAFFEAAPSLSGLVINEFSANSSTLLDNFNEAEDWIELYNSSNETITISGLYITDDLNTPSKYQIPSSNNSENTIVAGGYKILWADDETFEGFSHLPFKLNNLGEQIGIYQKIQNTIYKIDDITYEAQSLQRSTARYPDGIGPFESTGILTPGQANQIGEPLSTIDFTNGSLTIFPNPTSGKITLKYNFPINQLEIFNNTGVLVKQYFNVEQLSNVDISDLPNGLYLLAIQSNGKSEKKRIVKY